MSNEKLEPGAVYDYGYAVKPNSYRVDGNALKFERFGQVVVEANFLSHHEATKMREMLDDILDAQKMILLNDIIQSVTRILIK